MTEHQVPIRVSFRLAVIVIFAVVSCEIEARAKRKVFVPGQHAFVFDERFSALRAQPDLKAALLQRLRQGRVVGIVGARKNKSGSRFFKVAISRNRHGWILADAVARPGNQLDAERLISLIEQTGDDFAKMKMARLCIDEFRATKFAPRALLILAEAAERAAERVTRDAKRRSNDADTVDGLNRRNYFLSFTGLDRYNRIGVTFDYDEASDRIVYDGAAYRELIRKYPRSEEMRIFERENAKRAK